MEMTCCTCKSMATTTKTTSIRRRSTTIRLRVDAERQAYRSQTAVE